MKLSLSWLMTTPILMITINPSFKKTYVYEFVQLENYVYVLLVYDWRWYVWQGTWFQKVGRWCLCSGTFITILNFLPTLTNSILLDWRYGRWLLFLFPLSSPSHSTPFNWNYIKFNFELYFVWIFPRLHQSPIHLCHLAVECMPVQEMNLPS